MGRGEHLRQIHLEWQTCAATIEVLKYAVIVITDIMLISLKFELNGRKK